MDIQSFYETGTGTWTYLLADPESRAAAIIDPVWIFHPVSGRADAGFAERILEAADASEYRLEWVLETHAHADHLSAADLLRRRTGARIACSRGICGVQENFARVFNMTGMPTDGSQFDRLLDDGDVIQLGALEIRVLATPGHTGDSVTYVVGDAAFIGDTLFAPAFGSARCDFPGGDAGKLYDSVMRLYQLPGETRLFLCHDYPKDGAEPVRDVTVEDSRKNNIHINANTGRAEFVEMRTRRDAQLGLPALILPSLQINILAGSPPEADSNGVSYLKTPFDRNLADLIGKDGG